MSWLKGKLFTPSPVTYLRVACSVLGLGLFGNMFWALIMQNPTYTDLLISIGSAFAFLLIWVKLSLLQRRQWIILDNTLYITALIWFLQVFIVVISDLDTLLKVWGCTILSALGLLAAFTGHFERKYVERGVNRGLIDIRSDILDEYTYAGKRVQAAEATIPSFFRRKFVVSAAGISFIVVSVFSAKYHAEILPLGEYWPFGGIITGILCLIAPYTPARWPMIWGGGMMVTMSAIRSWGYFIAAGNDNISETVRATRLNSSILWGYFALMTAAFWFWVVLREDSGQ